MSYTTDERETIIQATDVDDKWNIYTRQRKIINKLIKQGYEPFVIEKEGDNIVACEFYVPIGKITFRNANATKRVMTEEQKQANIERLKLAREKKSVK